MNNKTAAIIVAGGTGSRMGSGVPKQFINLLGKPVISYTLDTFASCSFIEKMVVVCHSDYTDYCKSLTLGYDMDIIVTQGGSTRQESVYKGLSFIEDYNYVLVHDAVRCLVSYDDIKKLCDCLFTSGSCALAVRAKDTTKVTDVNNVVMSTIPRENLWQIQTPQAFLTKELLSAHSLAVSTSFEGTDDCSVVENAGGRITLIEGSYENIKITTPSDLEIAKVFLKGRL